MAKQKTIQETMEVCCAMVQLVITLPSRKIVASFISAFEKKFPRDRDIPTRVVSYLRDEIRHVVISVPVGQGQKFCDLLRVFCEKHNLSLLVEDD